MIPYGRQIVSDKDIQAVVEVLRSDFLTQGPVVPRFERSVKEYCRVGHAVATNSATSALHIACLALGVSAGDRVWTSPITFVASANCARYCGAQVDFVDIDPNTFNMCPKALANKLEKAAEEHTLPKVIIPVHMGGQSAQMIDISDIARSYGVKIIEDASHAIGGRYAGDPIGCCRYSDIAVFSFHPVKIITTAEGGMAVTNDTEVAEKMKRLRSHGVVRDTKLMETPSEGAWYYQQLDLGWNYRLTELQAALGLSQMDMLDEFVSKRHSLAHRYDELLFDSGFDIPGRQIDTYSSFHLYIVRVPPTEKRSRIFNQLREKNIGVNVHYIPVHLQPYYRKLGFSPGDFPISEEYYSRAISIPLHPGLNRENQEYIVSELKKSLNL